MPAFKICHIADVHLGYRRFSKLSRLGLNQREVDVCSSFKETLDLCAQQSPDLTIIAGDLFHSVRPSNTVITFCLKQLRSYQQQTKTPTIIVAGNHETPRRADTGCVLQILTAVEGVYVVDQGYQRLKFPELKVVVDCVPHAALKNFNWSELRSDPMAKFNILCTHAQVKGAPGSEGGSIELDFANLRASDWDYIALGHVHSFQAFGDNSCYPGATDFTSNNIWAECAEPKGAVVFEPGTKKLTRLKLSGLRPVIDLPTINSHGLDAANLLQKIEYNLAEIPGGLEGKIIRQRMIEVERHVYRQLDLKQIRRWRNQALHLVLEPDFLSLDRNNDSGTRIEQFSLQQKITNYCESQEQLQEERKKIISSLMLSYLNRSELSSEVN